MDNVPEPLIRALRLLAVRWAPLDEPWLVGGSCGLLLQSVPVPKAPRDLDVYIDAGRSEPFHRALASFAADAPAYSETDKYRSTLSHYDVEGVRVELVSGFEVRVPGARYRVQLKKTIEPLAAERRLQGVTVRLMPLAHELLFNLLRDRPDRYEPIARAMAADLNAHLPALRALLAANRFDGRWFAKVAGCLGINANLILEDVPCRR